MISVAQLQAFAPHCDAGAWAPALSIACERFAINTPGRIGQFMAQTGEETGGFVKFEENLNYTAAELFKQWPAHFPTLAVAAAYAHQPERIANRAYANRFGNGDEASGDGWRYRGRGPIQTTFRDGYAQARAAAGVDCLADPDLLLQPWAGALSSAAYWVSRGCNELADKGDLVGITRKVNGGLINLDHRQAMYDAWRKAVASTPAPAETVHIAAPPAPKVVIESAPVVAKPLPTLDPVEAPRLEIPPSPVPTPAKTVPANADEYAFASVVIAMLSGAALWIWTLLRKPKRGVAMVPAPVMQPGHAPKELSMSIVTKFWSQLFGPNAPGFNVAVATAAKSIDNLIAGNPAAQAVAPTLLSGVKQGVSTALSLADTEAGPALGVALAGLENIVDGLATAGLAKVGAVGAAPAATAFANAGMSQVFQVLHAALDHMETEVKAWVATPQTVGGVVIPAEPVKPGAI